MSKQFLIGFIFACFVFACASTFSYKYYGIDCGDCSGTLLAKEPRDDLPLTVCKPDDVIKGKCVVMMVEEFQRLRTDLIEVTERLKQCEGRL